jgi:iron only hydrogenase large subunit-like protein
VNESLIEERQNLSSFGPCGNKRIEARRCDGSDDEGTRIDVG